MTSGKQPDYNPTVPLDSDNMVPLGGLLEATVGRENVLSVSGTPTTSDGFPTSGRVAVDTSTDPDTYYVGDGSAWQAAASSIAVQGQLNTRNVNRETLSGDKTIATGDAQIHNIDPGGAARNVDLPAEEAGLHYIIGNRADAAEAITVRDDADSTIVTVNQNETAVCISDGTGWIAYVADASVSVT